MNIVLRDDGLDVNLYGLNQLNTFQDEKVFGLVNFHFGRGDLVNFLRRGYKSGPKAFWKGHDTFSLPIAQLDAYAGGIRIAANKLQ